MLQKNERWDMMHYYIKLHGSKNLQHLRQKIRNWRILREVKGKIQPDQEKKKVP